MLSAYELKLYFMILYMIPNKMMLDFYIFSSRMMNRVLTKTNSTGVIIMNGDAI